MIQAATRPDEAPEPTSAPLGGHGAATTPLELAQFYRALVAFGDHERLEPLLEAALALAVERANPREAIIELADEHGIEASHVVARGCSGDRAAAISSYSRGIIGQAIASGTTIATVNATEDERFLSLDSVRRHQIESVLCVPIGRDTPVGVLYLQGRRGTRRFQPYDESLQHDIALIARSMSPHVERLLARAGASPTAQRRTAEDDPFSAIVGSGTAITEVVERLRLAAPLDVHVLLTGPSGVGKSLLASSIHLASRRRKARFVEINCATLPEPLVENELFGSEPGAHSAALKTGSRGKVEAAEGGTLFLDEIGELSLGAQAKLLQLLQSKTYYRLGGTELRRADVRVVAATNVNLKTAIAERRFREDLYYRLQVLEARVPTLAERPEDLVALSSQFLDQSTHRHALARKMLSPSAIRAIQSAEWPGNVRQLANRIESAVIHAHLRGSDRIEGRDIFPEERVDESAYSLQRATHAFQRKHVLAVLTSTEWNVQEAARVLDIARSHIYNLMRAFELKRDGSVPDGG